MTLEGHLDSDAANPAIQPTSALGECTTMRRPEAGSEKVAVIWESLNVVPPESL
ncbi:hypothetical protein [Mycobacterium canetti]|uniref:hypothetical protein n=1 Tax=Mycobacterium canetti TaxID=78331 RepID=UPI00030868E5|nr:hypothetical protein [Mycobacterium canetti]